MAPMIVKGINYDGEVARGDFDPRCNDDSCTGSWMRVVPANYYLQQMSESEREAYRRIKREKQLERAEKMEEIESDPMLKYLYETELEQKRCARALCKDTQKLKKLGLDHVRATGRNGGQFKVALRYVKETWNNSRMPTILEKKSGNLDAEGNAKRMTFRQALRNSRSNRAAREERQIEKNAEEGNTKLKEFPNEFIEKVVATRTAQKLTQAQLAQKISRDKNELAALERGELVFTNETRPLMALLSWALGLHQ